MQSRFTGFVKKTEELKNQLQELLCLGDNITQALESKTQNFFETTPHLNPKILDKIQAQYSKFMFALLVVASDMPVVQRMSNTLDKMKKIFADPVESKTVNWMAVRRKLNQYEKKVILFEEEMIELASEYEALAAFSETRLPSVIKSLTKNLKEKIKEKMKESH